VSPVDGILDPDPFAAFRLSIDAKRVVQLPAHGAHVGPVGWRRLRLGRKPQAPLMVLPVDLAR
jgi:hypothetical protein